MILLSHPHRRQTTLSPTHLPTLRKVRYFASNTAPPLLGSIGKFSAATV
jgi:hypothetical protein